MTRVSIWRATTIAHLNRDLLVEGLLVRVRRRLGLGQLLLLRMLRQSRGLEIGDRNGFLRSGLMDGRVGPVLLEAGLLRERVGLGWREIVD